MSDFDGKQFYGFSMQNDPNLSTTTKNFEFRYMRPEFLEKAIQKVHNKDDSKIKQRNMLLQSHGRMRPATPEMEKQNIGIIKKDMDVETQINTSISKATEQIRKLSDREIENLIDTIKHKNEASSSKTSSIRCDSPYKDGHHSRQHNCSPKKGMTNFIGSEVHQHEMISRNIEKSCVQIADMDQKNQSSICTSITNNKTIHMVDNFEPQISIAHTPQIIDNVILEEYRRPQPKWVEIEEPRKEKRVEIDNKQNDIEINNPATSQSPYSNRYDSHDNMEYHQIPMQQYPQMTHMPAVLMTELLSDNVRHADEYKEETKDNYFLEDSDLEQELINRSQYTKFIQPRPIPNEMLNLSNDDDHNRVAEFIEIVNDLPEKDERHLRNLSTLQFTDFTDDAFDVQSQKNNHMKIYINGLTKQPCQNEHRSVTCETTKTPDRCLPPQEKQLPFETPNTSDRCSSPQTKQQPLKSKTKPTLRQQHLQQTFERLAGGTCSKSSTPHERVIRKSTPEPFQSGRSSRSGAKCPSVDKETGTYCKPMKSKNTARHSQKSNNLVVSRSIEDLKAEKSIIFNKMTATQEKMIEVLDKLRLSLLELNIPENGQETTRRQKNAFEFSVRFSRNFLYPLKGMQEDLILTSNEQFNSLTSNETCNRLCYMYGLLLQSLNTYQKQIRFFLLDHVHQKLTTLIEMIYSTTAICLEKKIFSKHDVIVDCLQQRCSKFLGFLVELQEGRQQMDRQSYRKLTLDKAHSKYDLKMFMNDLNMYEPKLVPKVITPNRPAKIKKNKAKRPINQVIVDDTPDTLVEKPPEDTIPTHIQGISDNKSSGCVLNSQFNMASGDGMSLDKNAIETLQNVTKEQLRQVLEPILDSFGSALGNQQNCETIETILNALNFEQFKTLKTEEQQNNDNKYAKEMKTETIELSSVDSLRNTCKSLKAAKQTKTLRQQNSHETLNKKRSSTTTGIIVDDDDDGNDNDNDNSNNKNDSNINANSKRNNNRNSSKRNSTTHLRSADGGGGEYNSEANHMGETTTTHASVVEKINKLKNSMNEDQINEKVRHKGEDLQSYGNLRNQEIQEHISTSDSEGGFNLKLEKHLKRNKRFTFTNLSKSHLKSHDSCISSQRSSSHNSQCQISSGSRKSSKIVLPHRNSFHCIQIVKTKSRSIKNKRDQTSPPAPSVTPPSSFSGHITDNEENVTETQIDQVPSQKNGEKNILRKINSMDNVKVSLTENMKTLKTGKTSENESDYDDDYVETREKRKNLECAFKLDTDNKVETFLGASYIEVCNKSDLPIYANNSPYNTSEDSPRQKSIERKQKYREIGKKIKSVPPISSENKNLQHIRTTFNRPLGDSNSKNQLTGNMESNGKHESKPNIPIDEMIQERDRFLELCKKNRFYKNSTYAEPWKVFSSITESLLNDVLNSVENDFAVGVSKFVDDFLKLETKT